MVKAREEARNPTYKNGVAASEISNICSNIEEFRIINSEPWTSQITWEDNDDNPSEASDGKQAIDKPTVKVSLDWALWI